MKAYPTQPPSFPTSGRRIATLVVAVGMLLVFSAPCWGESPPERRLPNPPKLDKKEERHSGDVRPPQGPATPPSWQQHRFERRTERQLPPPPKTRERLRSYQQLSPEDKDRLRGRLHEWKTFPPEQREDLRNRMDRWRQLPPQDRDLYRKRFEQWRSLRPEEQHQFRDRLKRWESLPAQEREEILRRFRPK